MLKEGIPVTEFSMPSMTGGSSESKIYDKYSVKYLKANLDEPAEVIQFQNIETQGLRGDDIVILTKDKYVFMDKYYVVMQYLEKND